MTDDGTSLLSQLHPKPSPASEMPIGNEDIIFIHSGQAEAGKFYTNANTFFEEEYKEEMLFKEYFNLDSGAEENKYVFSLSLHSTETDE